MTLCLWCLWFKGNVWGNVLCVLMCVLRTVTWPWLAVRGRGGGALCWQRLFRHGGALRNKAWELGLFYTSFPNTIVPQSGRPKHCASSNSSPRKQETHRVMDWKKRGSWLMWSNLLTSSHFVSVHSAADSSIRKWTILVIE